MEILIALIAVALIFDFMNGRNDAANSIATIVSTRVLSPRVAVAWAAFFNFVAFLVFGLSVASTVGKGIISPDVISDHVILAGKPASPTRSGSSLSRRICSPTSISTATPSPTSTSCNRIPGSS